MNVLGLPVNLHQLIARMEGGQRSGKKGTRKMPVKEIRYVLFQSMLWNDRK